LSEGFAKTPEPPYFAVIFTPQRAREDNGYEAMAGQMFRLAGTTGPGQHEGEIGGIP